MAIVIESVSAVAQVSAVNTITITKPTGLAEGDLLIAKLVAYAADGNGSGTINLRSGWTDAITTGFASDLAQSVQYKIADAGDVAASNFAFTKSTSTDAFVGQLMRVSGHNIVTPVGTAQSYTNGSANSATFAGTLSSYTPGIDGALVILQFGTTRTTGGGNFTFSAYTTTASGISLTEGYDTAGNDGNGGASVASAYGIQTTAAALTAYGATISGSMNAHYGHIVVILPPVNATGTNTLITTTSTTFNQTGTADTISSNILATATAEAFTQTGRGTSPTPWTNPDKSTTPTWNNPDK